MTTAHVTPRFPVMLPYTRAKRDPLLALGCPMTVPWDLVLPHEEQAHRNHDQTLRRLAERGGLDPWELLAVLRDQRWSDVAKLPAEDVVAALLGLLDVTPDRFRRLHDRDV